eukprot:COSAG06_NODE_309_length_17782_cov_49.326698_5_plen_67_part_00
MQSIRRHAQASFRLHHVVALVHSDERGSAAALGAAGEQQWVRPSVGSLQSFLSAKFSCATPAVVMT